VEYDLTLLEAVLRQTFPSALVRITQMGDHIILEGQARDQRQLAAIDSAVRAYLQSQQTSSNTRQPPPVSDLQEALPEAQMPPDSEALLQPDEEMIRALPELTARAAGGDVATAQIINLMTLPGVQQVLLQVRIAELNRTGLREVGADTFFEFGNGNILGTKIAGAQATLKSTAATATSAATANGLTPGTSSTAFGIFPNARAEIILRVLRENSLLRVLAEPNLVAMSGHEASFLAGGEFPVPVAQGSVGVSNVTVQFKQFGVQLNFVPQILDDNVIHLEVRPEVSTIDPALGTTLVIGGTPVPGINTRRVHTTVELREGESLALAGLLQVTLDAKTSRIPGLGDLPYIGPLFSNTSHKRTEKELLVIVTPYLVAPTAADCATRLPGDDITDPNDLEFYLLNRIEGRTGREFYSTTSWDDPWHFARLIKLQRSQVCGPCGFVSQTADVEQSPTSSSVPLLVQPAGVTGP
jgi:pilus assembly protein CpaC